MDGDASGRELALLALCHLESYREPERASALEIFWTHAPSEAGDDGADAEVIVLVQDCTDDTCMFAPGFATMFGN